MADQKVGSVSHYYNHLGVAIIEVESPFSVGDTIKFVRRGDDEELFQQKVESIQEEHANLEKAVKGKSVGVKVDQLVHKGVDVFKV